MTSTIDVSVRNPVTHNTWDKGRYTSFEISVNTSNKSFCLSSSKTRRRFSEFEWLRKTLKNHHPLVTPPTLPAKKFFEDRFDPNFIAFRMKGMEDFLNKVIEEKYYLSDTTFHLFLQTNLSIKEIKEYIEGHMTTYSLDSLWKANGIKENCSEFAGLYTVEDNDWSKVHHSNKPRVANLAVPTFGDEGRDSHNSDISSSLSDSEDGLAEFPSLSLVNNPTCNLQTDSGSSSTPDKWYSPKLSRKKAEIEDEDSLEKEKPSDELSIQKEKTYLTEDISLKKEKDSQELSTKKTQPAITGKDSILTDKSNSNERFSQKPQPETTVKDAVLNYNLSTCDESVLTDIDNRSIKSIELGSVSNFVVSDEFSINKSHEN